MLYTEIIGLVQLWPWPGLGVELAGLGNVPERHTCQLPLYDCICACCVQASWTRCLANGRRHRTHPTRVITSICRTLHNTRSSVYVRQATPLSVDIILTDQLPFNCQSSTMTSHRSHRHTINDVVIMWATKFNQKSQRVNFTSSTYIRTYLDFKTASIIATTSIVHCKHDYCNCLTLDLL